MCSAPIHRSSISACLVVRRFIISHRECRERMVPPSSHWLHLSQLVAEVTLVTTTTQDTAPKGVCHQPIRVGGPSQQAPSLHLRPELSHVALLQWVFAQTGDLVNTSYGRILTETYYGDCCDHVFLSLKLNIIEIRCHQSNIPAH